MHVLRLLKTAAVTAFHPWLWRMRPLRRADLHSDPFVEFGHWFRKAQRCFWLAFPEAMCLSTIDEEGCPDGRLVLLKSFDENGFVFYTNTDSAKGRSLQRTGKAAVTFYWEALQRQIRIKGEVEPVAGRQADEYFATRPRQSQLGAWASQQSEPLASRQVLEERLEHFRRKFQGASIPRPPNWSGYRLIPHVFEYWQIRPSRLHDRFRYSRLPDGTWLLERLNP